MPSIYRTMNQSITKIILLGYMGSGKSTVGRSLASKLGLEFLDLDDHIVNKEQISIPEIFEQKGEVYFRKKEGTYLAELLESDQAFVLSLGGGTPCYGHNMELVLNKGVSIYLKLDLKTLVDRLIREKDARPLIADQTDEQLTEFVAKHLFERANFYEKAHYTLSAAGKTPDLLAEEILKLLG